MNEYLLLMHADARDPETANSGEAWAAYLARLRELGCFEGGSSLGRGISRRLGQPDSPAKTPIDGFIRVRCDDLASALALVAGNPAYEAGATVEVRELVKD